MEAAAREMSHERDSRRVPSIDESLPAQFAEAAMLGGKTVSHSSLWLLDSWRAATVASVGEVFS